ncbi:hypothetical protein SAMN05444409_1221 [Epilithonimonas zeae]|uniref:Uncharacterized protein n=2 Tax=Epilithonimonas zeae TaxID=1416779 RepID=A0A1N6FE67_9FLAO|nr:hypothetical protein SAMN05444409_1221 [Epilithonimonas zeae]
MIGIELVKQVAMKAKELRIGNLVSNMTTGNNEQVDINIIQSIMNGSTDYKPVELNDEWFNKFDFSKEHFGYYYENIYEFSVLTSRNNAYIVRWGNQVLAGAEPIRYVHELQNIFFALKGSDLPTKRPYKNIVSQALSSFA